MLLCISKVTSQTNIGNKLKQVIFKVIDLIFDYTSSDINTVLFINRWNFQTKNQISNASIRKLSNNSKRSLLSLNSRLFGCKLDSSTSKNKRMRAINYINRRKMKYKF